MFHSTQQVCKYVSEYNNILSIYLAIISISKYNSCVRVYVTELLIIETIRPGGGTVIAQNKH